MINFSKNHLLISLLYFLLNIACCHARQAPSPDELNVLQPFFRLLLEHSEMGYVLYDKKPICMVDCYSRLLDISDDEMMAAIYQAKPILQNSIPKDNNILFRYERDKNLFIINKKLALKAIEDNLSLFRHALGPNITPESLLSAIITSEKPFMQLLKYDQALVGILLGFGADNSIHYHRMLYLENGIFYTTDLPPLLSYGGLSLNQNHLDFIFYTNEEDALPYDKFNITPSIGYHSLEEERISLLKNLSAGSEKLLDNQPRLVFADYGYISSARTKELEETQTDIQKLLNNENWLEVVLQKIYGDTIYVKNSSAKPLSLASADFNLLFAKQLKTDLIERKARSVDFKPFLDGLRGRSEIDSTEDLFVYSPQTIDVAKKTRKTLEETDKYFAQLDIDKENICVLKNYLYYKTVREGFGEKFPLPSEVVVDLDITDIYGRNLHKDYKIKLNLRETIPGFAHGLKEMKRGEKRILYIHPAVAYGVNTFLEKGSYLKAFVTLHEAKEDNKELEPLRPFDLSFIKDDNFLNRCEVSLRHRFHIVGKMKRSFLQLIPGVDVDIIAKRFEDLDDFVELSQEEFDQINRFLWNSYL